MDESTRQILHMRRDTLIARVRDLDRQKNALIHEIVSGPTFDPSSHRLDPRVASLTNEQDELEAKIRQIESQLGGGST